MKKFNSAAHAACLAVVLPLDDDHFNNRSDEWWNLFWYYFGLDIVKRLAYKELI